MNNLSRYSCQIALSDFGKRGQKKLSKAKVLVIGMGGLGCPVSGYLAAMGVGTLGIVDYDRVSSRNLHRQILFRENDIGTYKVYAAEKQLSQQNPGINITTHLVKLDNKNILELIKRYDIVVDCTDNFYTRYLINDACVISKKPLVYGAIFQYEGQVAVWNVQNKDKTFSSNYRDIYKSISDSKVPDCDTAGVIPTIAGVIGCIQANEVIKYILGSKDLLVNKLFVFDIKSMDSCIVSLPSETSTSITRFEKNVDIPVLSPKDLKELMVKNSCALIDVRSQAEHRQHNIGGKNIPLGMIVRNNGKFLDTKATVFYCNTGRRSDEVVRHLLINYPGANIFSLEGGIELYDSLYQG